MEDEVYSIEQSWVGQRAQGNMPMEMLVASQEVDAGEMFMEEET